MVALTNLFNLLPALALLGLALPGADAAKVSDRRAGSSWHTLTPRSVDTLSGHRSTLINIFRHEEPWSTAPRPANSSVAAPTGRSAGYGDRRSPPPSRFRRSFPPLRRRLLPRQPVRARPPAPRRLSRPLRPHPALLVVTRGRPVRPPQPNQLRQLLRPRRNSRPSRTTLAEGPDGRTQEAS